MGDLAIVPFGTQWRMLTDGGRGIADVGGSRVPPLTSQVFTPSPGIPSMGVDVIVTGGTLVTPDTEMAGDIAIADGRIVAIGDRDTFPASDEVLDASGKLVFPGIVDPHVHFDGYLSKDPYDRGSAAAALGGVTTFINFAWQAWIGDLSPWDEEGTLLEAVERQKRKGEDSIVDFGLHGVITREDPAVFEEFPRLIEAGVTSMKMFTAYEIALSNGFLHRALDRIATHDLVAAIHAEDHAVCEALTSYLRDAGKRDPRWYPRSRPDYSEAMAVDDVVRLALATGAKYYGVHVSSREAAATFAAQQGDGSRLRAETCTHYTTLDEEAYVRQGTLPICAPPLRHADDRNALFEHLRRGALSIVSTDHTAFRRRDKDVDRWWDSSFGVNSVQYSLPVFFDEAVNVRGLSPSFVVEVMCTNPARTFGLPGKGTLEPGTDADLVIFDPHETQTISAEDNRSISDYSIYEGREVTGRVETTMVRGSIVADDGEVTGRPGHGRFVHRECPDWSR